MLFLTTLRLVAKLLGSSAKIPGSRRVYWEVPSFAYKHVFFAYSDLQEIQGLTSIINQKN